MALEQALCDSGSAIYQLLDRHCKLDAASRFLAKLGLTNAAEDGNAIERMAFLYLLRWRYGLYYPATTFGWLGATLEQIQTEYTQLVWSGNLNSFRRPEVALGMAAYEYRARCAAMPEMERGQASIDRISGWAYSIPDELVNYFHRYVHAPTFQGSYRVGGAHATMIVDHSLVEVAWRVDLHLLLRAVAHLALDFDDAWGIQDVVFYVPGSDRYARVLTRNIVRNLTQLRQQAKSELPELQFHFDRRQTWRFAFRDHDIEGFF